MSGFAADSTDIVGKPYNDRQRIVVVEDGALQQAGGHALRWRDVRSLTEARQRLHDARHAERLMTPSQKTLRSVRELSHEGIAILPVTPTEAAALALPAGHPLDGQVYVGDPANSARYHLAADFHLRVCEWKFADAVDLLGTLGARRFTVRSEHGWGRKAAGKLTLPVQAIPLTLKGVLRGRATRKVLFQAELVPNDVREPDDIPWFRHEVMWQRLADLRMHSGLRSFELGVENRSDYQVTAELGKRIRKVQLGIGGTYEEFVSTKWVISGEFDEIPNVASSGADGSQVSGRAPRLGSWRKNGPPRDSRTDE